MSNFNKQHRVLEIAITSDETANTVVITSVKYRRDGRSGTAFDVAFSAGAAGTNATGHETVLGEAVPQGVTMIRIIPTHV